MKNKNIYKYLLVAVIIALIGSNIYLFTALNEMKKNKTSTTQSNNTTVQNIVSDIKTTAVDAVNEVKDSVVGIQVYANGQVAGSGSGVIYEVNGNEAYVITNHHVINGASQIEVVFSNGESAEASLVGSDQYSDIALLKLTSDIEMKPIKIGDSSLLDPGETVLAVGSPLGIQYSGTVTQGVVSTNSRSVSVDLNGDNIEDWEMSVIQTDAAINPGNSGGALVNIAGELVGITSMKLSDTSVEGMGFALPINQVIHDIEQIKETGKIARPVLGISGVSISDLTTYELRMYKINTTATDGVYVAKVIDGSAASKGGIEPGDVITSFDGQTITSYKSFVKALYAKEVGDTVEIQVNRGGKIVTLSVTLSE